MEDLKYIAQCVAITFVVILIAETFIVGLAFAMDVLGVGDGSITSMFTD